MNLTDYAVHELGVRDILATATVNAILDKHVQGWSVTAIAKYMITITSNEKASDETFIRAVLRRAGATPSGEAE